MDRHHETRQVLQATHALLAQLEQQRLNFDKAPAVPAQDKICSGAVGHDAASTFSGVSLWLQMIV